MVQIVDASVAIKWFVEERGRDKALHILQDVISHPERFAVPELFYYELAHVFHRVVPKPSSVQVSLLSMITTLGVNRFSLTPELLSELRTFQDLGLSGYDAAYIALAKITKGKWLTFDAIAHGMIQHLKLSQLLM